MHVLVVPSWYPTENRPWSGIFFTDHARRSSGGWSQSRRYRAAIIGLRRLYEEGLPSSEIGDAIEYGLATLRLTRFVTPQFEKRRLHYWSDLCQQLFAAYIDRYGNPDLLHAHSAVHAGIAAARISREYDIPFLITEHHSGFQRGIFSTWLINQVREAASEAKGIVTVSAGLANAIKSRGIVVGATVIPNVVDVSEFMPGEVVRSRGTRFRFVCVGQLHKKKGIDILLEAFALRFRKHQTAELRIVGGGAKQRQYERLAKRLGISETVTFSGTLRREQVHQELVKADCLVSSSRIETFGVVLIEAMAVGLPVIATRCGGPEEIVTDEVGKLVDKEDAVQLADAMFEMTKESSRYDPVKQRQWVTDRYAPTVVASRYTQLYDEILESRVKQS